MHQVSWTLLISISHQQNDHVIAIFPFHCCSKHEYHNQCSLSLSINKLTLHLGSSLDGWRRPREEMRKVPQRRCLPFYTNLILPSNRGWAEQENEFSGHFNKLLKNYRFPYSSIVQLVPLCTIIYSIDFVCFFIFGRFHFMIFCFIWNRCAENRKLLPASHTFLANMDGW